MFFYFIDLLTSVYRYIGHLKERSLKDQMAKDPTEVIRKAVWRMLPSNNLRDVSTLLSQTFSNHLNPHSYRYLRYSGYRNFRKPGFYSYLLESLMSWLVYKILGN